MLGFRLRVLGSAALIALAWGLGSMLGPVWLLGCMLAAGLAVGCMWRMYFRGR